MMLNHAIILLITILLFTCNDSKDDSAVLKNNTGESVTDLSLKRAIEIAYENLDAKNYTDSFEIVSDSFRVLTTLRMIDDWGTDKYLYVKREDPNCLMDVFLFQNGTFKKVISHEQWTMTYVNDFIKDVNGDGRKDFLVNWYGASGCCLKNFVDVYLQLSDGRFSPMFEFINPTFSTEEKMIRGITYGHPGEAALYKYQWNDLQVDTLEYLIHDPHHSSNFIKSKYLPLDERNIKSGNEILHSVPDEYKSIDGFDWFMHL